ncbi:sulfurtransferase [Paenalcaligenes faecalis]|uniref:sulfurtransferase n=1 Tax=Paenalcaligenes faecalis TaxID=2980099 RepID=UPI0022B99B6B|nr:sulfurtransferase [Paenalcaligenes faecalis]
MTQLLISAKELQQQLHQKNTVIFDVRHDLMNHQLGRQQYMQAHIPGAYFLDNEAELVGQMTGQNGRHPLPDLARFVQLLQQYQLNKETQIVIYDASQAHMAARTWWLLRWAGFNHVMILDGGWQAWLAAGGVTDNHLELPPVPEQRVAVTIEPQQPTVDAAAIVAQLDQPIYTLVDARAAERYRGEKEPIDPVAGRIPGALNRPTSQNLQPDGHFKSVEQLRAEFNELLGDVDVSAVVHYCGSGMTACHNIFAMELAGLSGASLYPGSWSEWIADKARPQQKG